MTSEERFDDDEPEQDFDRWADPDAIDLLLEQHGTDPAPSDEPSEQCGRLLGLRPVGEVAAEVDAAPTPGWLLAGVFPQDAHGVLAAGWKRYKTWLILCAATSAASGTPWLGLFDVQTPGPVVMFLGEGGARKMTRRGRAIAASMGLCWEALPIVMAERVPHLRDVAQVNALRLYLSREVDLGRRVALVILDPLYLAAAGAQASQLYDMAEVLSPIQQACQEYGAALLIAHHNNRDTTRTGSQRMSGAGPAEWGRVLISVDQLSKRVDVATGRSDAVLKLHFEGDEITGGDHTIRVSIWTDDPADIGSAMHFEVSPVDQDDPATADTSPLANAAPSVRRCHDTLADLGDWRKASEIGDHLAKAGHPLRVRTIQGAMKTLTDLGLVEAFGEAKGTAWSWRIATGDDPEEDEDVTIF